MTNFHPEMGQTAPKSAKIVGVVMRGGVRVKWTEADHSIVLTTLAMSGVKVKDMERFETVDGQMKWAGLVTMKAYSIIMKSGLVANECLL